MYQPHCGLSYPLVPELYGSTVCAWYGILWCFKMCLFGLYGFDGRYLLSWCDFERLSASERIDLERISAGLAGCSLHGFGSWIELCSLPILETNRNNVMQLTVRRLFVKIKTPSWTIQNGTVLIVCRLSPFEKHTDHRHIKQIGKHQSPLVSPKWRATSLTFRRRCDDVFLSQK